VVIVTDKKYYLDGYVVQIADKICERVEKRKQDILVQFDGREGSGKTGASVNFAYYISQKTGRPFSVENMFFDLDKMIKFAGSTEKQIILWDEAALGGLSSDWSNKSQRKLKSMLMVCRKKRHVFLFNVPRFYRLNADIIERTHCLFHIYENDQEQPGNFMFIGGDSLVALYMSWKSRKYADYWKYKKLHGNFRWALPLLIDEEKYEAMKDKAILDLANDKQEEKPGRWFNKDGLTIKNTYFNLKEQGMKTSDILKIMEIDRKTLARWSKEWE